MDTILEAQLERMETALGTLLTSIITYNPSISAADELLLADDELSRGLEQLTRHQNNYTRILQLRHEAEQLDSQIKNSVQLLADVRKDLLAIPLDASREPVKPVPYKTLLTYAKNISPFTIPPTFRPKPATSGDEESKATQPTQDGARLGDESAVASTPAGQDGEAPAGNQYLDNNSTAHKALSEEQQAWLTELNNLPFQPWPGEAEMMAGALHVLNHQVINGNDPTDLAHVLEEEKYLADQKRMEVDDEARRRGMAGRAVQQSRPSQGEDRSRARFGLDDDDSDEDD